MVTERWTSLKGLEQCWVLRLDMRQKHVLAELALRRANTFGFFGSDDDASFVLQEREVISGANVRKSAALSATSEKDTRVESSRGAQITTHWSIIDPLVFEKMVNMSLTE